MAQTLSRRSLLAALPLVAVRGQNKRSFYIVPNFHPASCGWLTNFSTERVYCANSYFDHLDRVRDDPNYSFVLSECNNMIAMLNFRPDRAGELRGAIRSGRVELVNGFFLESTVNLSGGEALVRLGVAGLRWQQRVFGVRPRFAYCIDTCGIHSQMAQITAGLGLEALVYVRGNATGKTVHWLEGPDGTRTLAIAPWHYADMGDVFGAAGKLTQEQVAELQKRFDARTKRMPEGAPAMTLGGKGDYSLAPMRPDYPSAFLREWAEIDPITEVRFTTLSQYMDVLKPRLASGDIKLATLRGGTSYAYHSFWIQCPRVKTAYRRCEHQLQAAEMLATAASLRTKYTYPSEPLDRAWLQMFLNMDRNTLWGAAGGMVFEHETSWDASDRFRSVEAASRAAIDGAGKALSRGGTGVALFNALNWKRQDPVILSAADVPEGVPSEALPDGRALSAPVLGPVSLTPAKRASGTPAAPRPIPLPEAIETRFYTARVDQGTGAITSLKLKASGREVLSGPANVIVAERPQKQAGEVADYMLFRAQRARLGSSSDGAVRVTASRGPVATTVISEGTFYGGGACRRVVRFYHDSPRIDFETTLNDVPDRTVVVAEFPLSEQPAEVRRAIPYGFTHGAWPEPTEQLPGRNQDITPALRWSHYAFSGGGGFAIFDRGLCGRELTGRTPVIFLLNTTETYRGYPNAWLSGKGRHVLEYAMVAHEGSWPEARVPQMAWEYNDPPYAVSAAAGKAVSFLETSGNVIVEALHRDGAFIEVRLAECFGVQGTAQVRLALPHKGASLTNMLGEDARPMTGGPHYRFPVRPQQIVTLRFRASSEAPEPNPLLEWDALVPPAKRPMLRQYSREKGHPPSGV